MLPPGTPALLPLPLYAALPPAKQIYHLERVWSMLENRAGQQVRCSLRPGLATPGRASGLLAAT